MVTESGHIQNSEIYPGSEDSRYHLLNDMIMSWRMKDGTTVERIMEQYQKLDKLSKDTFTVI